MNELLPNPNDLFELDSVEVTEPQDNRIYQKCNRLTGHVSSSQNGSNVMAFLKRNVFVILTMASVALGKFSINTNHLPLVYH